MALAELLFKKTRAIVGIVQFDASLSESHASTISVTSHAIEAGSTITDHVFKNPELIEITGVVSNTPIVFLADVLADSPLTTARGISQTRVDDAYNELLRVQKSGELVEVVTSLRNYSNMLLESVTVDRDATLGNVLRTRVTLREVLVANSISLDLPSPQDVANKMNKAKGKVATKEATPKQAEKAETTKSMLADLLGVE